MLLFFCTGFGPEARQRGGVHRRGSGSEKVAGVSGRAAHPAHHTQRAGGLPCRGLQG